MKKFFLLLIWMNSLTLFGGIFTDVVYHGPTEQLIKRESRSRIESKLKKMKIPSDLFPFFDSIAAEEDWGHIGYHGTNQKFRIYQDIIRFTVEEILGIPVREDFHFLRIPGDEDLNLKNIDEFVDYWGKKINNKNELRAKQLLSLNFGIYSNFDSRGSCSLNLFVHDFSKTKIDYVKHLSPFYKELGIPPSALKSLFAIGEKWLNGESGILLQVSECSHVTDPNQEAFNLADQLCYPSKIGGVLFEKSLISLQYAKILSDRYIYRHTNIAPQLRLILSNQVSLNPFSQLIVRRWDLYDQETIMDYEIEMRNYIRNLLYDSEKVEDYRAKLIETWL